MATEITPLEKFNILSDQSDYKQYRNSDEKRFINYR